MTEAPEEFAALLQKVRLGDRHALSDLLTCYERELDQAAQYLLGRSLRTCLDPADLVQSVHRTLILCLLQNKINVSTPDNLVALALTVARNKAVRAARQWRCQQRHADTVAHAETRTTTAVPEEDPARLAEFHDTVENFCKGLSEIDRQLVRLRLQGYSTAEVARELGLNADVLRVRLSRLRQQLRQSHSLSEWI